MASDAELYRGLADFRSALRRFLAASERINRDAGVTQQQYQALLVIKTRQDGGTTIRELADELILTHQAAVQLIDRLARADLVSRVASSGDRRLVYLQVSPRGEEMISHLAAQHLDEIRRRGADITAALVGLAPEAAPRPRSKAPRAAGS